MTKFRRRITTIVAALLIAAGCGGGASTASSTAAASALVDIGAGIKGPSGLHATVYATGLAHAAAIAFDAQQRVWVATAAYTVTSSWAGSGVCSSR